MKNTLASVLAALLMTSLLTAGAAAKDPEGLVKLRASYHSQIAAIEEEHKEDLRRAPGEYAESLASLEKTYQMAGDLKSLLAVREERQRFAANSQVSAVTVLKGPPKLATLQGQFLKDYKAIGVTKSRRILDLTQKYSARLGALQKKLTQKGEIDDALKVMTEQEGIPDSRIVKAAQFEIAARGEAMVQPEGERRALTIDAQTLGRRLHGEILSWNSESRKLSVKYDFGSDDQLQDWKGGEMDVLDRISCRQAPASLTPQFDLVTRIEYDGYLYEGTGRITLKLGDSLSAQIGAGPENGMSLVFQNSEHYPIVSAKGGARLRLRYSAVLDLQNGTVRWEVNDKSLGSGRLTVPISYPVRVGVGHEASHTAYGNIVVTGILSRDYLTSFGD